MASDFDGPSKVITVYQADMVNLGGGVYQLDIDALRLECRAWEASEEGIAFDETHFHNTEVTISGTTFVRTVGFINGWTVNISPAGAYQVSCVGANHNLQDVYNNLTGPTLLPNNSAGLIANPAPSAVADAVWDEAVADHAAADSFGEKVGRRLNLAVEDEDPITIIREIE